jgi:hypothetical protein
VDVKVTRDSLPEHHHQFLKEKANIMEAKLALVLDSDDISTTPSTLNNADTHTAAALAGEAIPEHNTSAGGDAEICQWIDSLLLPFYKDWDACSFVSCTSDDTVVVLDCDILDTLLREIVN